MSELFSNKLDRSIITGTLIIGLVINLSYSLFQIITGAPSAPIISNLITAGLLLIIYIIYRRKHYSITYWLFTILISLITTVNTIYFGNINIQLYAISVGVLTTFLSRKKKYWGLISWIIVAVTFSANYWILYKNGQIIIPNNMEMPFFLNTFFPIAIIYMVTRFYQNINDSQREDLLESNNYKSRLISILSHDFRSPLGNIKGLLNLYTTGLIQEEKLRPHLISLEKDLDKTISSLDNTLYWIKNQLKRSSPKIIPVDINQLTLDTLSELESDTNRKGIDVEMTAKHGFQPQIKSDKNMLTIILRNILSNAVKFCPNENGRIKIHFFDVSNEWVGLSISDNGVGMEESRVKALFSSDSESTFGTKGERGFGLGLSLVKTFTDILKIDVNVESQINHGSTFTLRIARTLLSTDSED